MPANPPPEDPLTHLHATAVATVRRVRQLLILQLEARRHPQRAIARDWQRRFAGLVLAIGRPVPEMLESLEVLEPALAACRGNAPTPVLGVAAPSAHALSAKLAAHIHSQLRNRYPGLIESVAEGDLDHELELPPPSDPPDGQPAFFGPSVLIRGSEAVEFMRRDRAFGDLATCVSTDPYRLGDQLDSMVGELAFEFEQAGSSDKSHRLLKNENVFRLEPGGWRVSYRGTHATSLLRPILGLTYLQELLRRPNKEIRTSSLFLCARPQEYSTLADLPADCSHRSPRECSRQDVLDSEALEDLRRAEAESNERAETAFNEGDLVTANEMLADAREIAEELTQSTYRGESRAFRDGNESTRRSVCQAIGRAIKTVRTAGLAHLADHLSSAVKLGNRCAYKVDRPMRWLL